MNTILSKDDLKKVLIEWYQSWNEHDLDNVMKLFHDDVLFVNWTGAIIKGKAALRRAWNQWFGNHGGFRFTEKDTFIDETAQKVLFRWILEWPSLEKGHEGRLEIREGVDILHFKDGKIIQKLTYSKTQIEIDGNKVLLAAKQLE